MLKLIPQSTLAACMAAFSLILASCGEAPEDGQSVRELRMSLGGRINTLDPAFSADTESQYMILVFYDTPLQYNYAARPYKLEPSMLACLPECSADMTSFKCTLRDDLYFQDATCFEGLPKEARKVRAEDMVFSLLRLADGRLNSPGFWTLRGKVKGIDKFREESAKAKPGDFSIYDKGCEGLRVVDGRTFIIELETPDPRMPYTLAMPYCAAVSRRAVEFYADEFVDHPAGSGPFKLESWLKDYSITFVRNDEYRRELFPEAANPSDRKRTLPLLDKATCYLVKQPLASWLMFLKGELDICGLDSESFNSVVGENGKLARALSERGIQLIQAPEFQVNYVGFNMADPILGANANLRKAICLAFDKDLRRRHSNGRLTPAYCPVPPGVSGHLENFTGPYGSMNLDKAKEFMNLAGYPKGIDPKTKAPLELTFDLAGSDNHYREIAELMVSDMKRVGIKIVPQFNSRPRFFQKLPQGQVQLFRIAWTGDYPDAENFLQLFYGKNAGACNRAFYKDPEFDIMYEDIRPMPDSPGRTQKYEAMSRRIAETCPWVIESYSVSSLLTHAWLQNYKPHDFGFNRWKLLSIDPELRAKSVKEFRPLSMDELRK